MNVVTVNQRQLFLPTQQLARFNITINNPLACLLARLLARIINSHSPPTEKAIRAQNILLGLAKESLESARKDTAEIKADYEAQHRAFLTNHGRKPTDEELVLAHHRRYNQHQLNFNAEFEEKYQECLQAGNEEECDDEDDEDDEDEDEGDADKGDYKEPKDKEESHDSDSDVGERLLDLPYDSPTPDASSQPKPSSAANLPKRSNIQRELIAWESEAGDA
ncbi:hypothetical protein JADG_005667 [Aureobasidium aubasidani]|nr:hypothetical protein JADG_005667 [Aureobasidium pullulans]